MRRPRDRDPLAARRPRAEPHGLDEWSPDVRHVDVDATHIGMVANPDVLRHIAVALAVER
ncbi:MAG: hypothetical protein QNJ12_05135 [Ilumatobacter sp.]|uniref:hypothetical protein n=1 Tax=Ilumatobacter sp. TaxID=1967498 RepID=UPI0026270214|nr:hypothetical protein [Ilumatobacter sp.]MDJ0768153.1 hypothetical protein [Ilumatobacter sp.]